MTGKRDSLLSKASPPLYYEEIWNYYWTIRRGESLLCSEILAYKELTNADIGAYEVRMLLYIDDCVNERLRFHREKK